MEPSELDNVDRGILHLLQVDARNNTAAAIAEEVGVAPNTVWNQIERLETNGVIQGYSPQIDYEWAGFQLRVVFVCIAPISQRSDFANQALEIEGVIDVREILSGHQNLVIEAVGDTSEDITVIGSELEAIGLAIQDERFLKSTRTKPFDDFGRESSRSDRSTLS